MTPEVLLIDGDMIVHRSCCAVEKDTRFEDRYHILYSDAEEAWGVLMDTLSELTEIAGTSDVLFAFSDKGNWRRSVDPTYKAHRKDGRKPLAYWDVVDRIKNDFDFDQMANLEADDVLGILQTHSAYGSTAIYSLDKDLKQIPGLHLRDDEIVEITQAEADRFHLLQALMGDKTDGYDGCPGVGAVVADRALSSGMKLIPRAHTLLSGKRKGETEARWEETPADSPWDIVVSYYEKAGMTEDDALRNARLARILRQNDYDNGEIKLWTYKKS